MIVYDGNRLAGNPDALRRGRLTTQYSEPPEEADDRILHLAESSVHHREKVIVVTSDRALMARLPAGTGSVEPTNLLRRIRNRPDREENATFPQGDFSDVEAHFLALDRLPEEATAESPLSGKSVPVERKITCRKDVAPNRGVRDEATLQRKRARGRRKQQKRIARYCQRGPHGKRKHR